MNKVQSHSLDILVDFDRFCQKYGVEYCLAWGTLLGAIRHKGFIPWDDDIDLSMDQENWLKLKSLAQQGKLPSHLRFEDSLTNPKCLVPKIRDLRYSDVVDTNGSVGYFVDIFPFRRYTVTEKRIISVCCFGNRLRKYRKQIKNPVIRALYTVLMLIPHEFSNLLKKITFPFIEKNGSNEGEYLDKEVFLTPKEWFKTEDFYPYVRVEFEGHQFPVPRNSDAVLKARYGDYMVPVEYDKQHYQD